MQQKGPLHKTPSSAVRIPERSRQWNLSNRPNPVLFVAGALVTVAAAGGMFMAFTGGLQDSPSRAGANPENVCKSADCVKKRDKIVVSYTGTLSDGRVFESSSDGGRTGWAVIEVSAGGPPPGFHNAILGMKTGESKTFTVPFRDGYWPKTIVVEYVRSAFGKDLEKLKEGSQYEMMPWMTVKIVEIGKKTVSAEQQSTHWLAGENLTYSVKIEKNLGPSSAVNVTAPQPAIVGASKWDTTISNWPPPAREDGK